MDNSNWVTGKLSNGLTFDGVNEYVNCGDVAAFERTDPFSVECWFKTSQVPFGIFAARMQGGSLFRGWQFYKVSGNGRVGLELISDFGSDDSLRVTNTANLHDNIFHHLIITYDGSSTAAGVTIYVDGGSVSKDIQNDSLTATVVPSGINLNINGRADGNGLLTATMDEVVIYDKELSATEVTFRYNSGLGRETFTVAADKPTIERTAMFNPVSVTTWDSFSQTLGGGNQGSIGYNLYKVDKANRYYWNGSAWAAGGSSSNYNSAAVINTNISTFDGSPDEIGFIAYLISDGEQAVEIDLNTIGYTATSPPSVNAGIDKNVIDHQTLAPFSDAVISDPDGDIENATAFQDIEDPGIFTQILKGGYATLQEAIQAFTYEFNNVGAIDCNLKIIDEQTNESIDTMVMAVSLITVTFNIKDLSGNHLTNFSFFADDGSGWVSKTSPFDYGYNWQGSDFTVLFDKVGFVPQSISVSPTVHTENITLLTLTVDPQAIATAVWNKQKIDHTDPDSFGYANQNRVPSEALSDYKADVSLLSGIAANVVLIKVDTDKIDGVVTQLQEALGLMFSNYKLDNLVYTEGLLTFGKISTYSTKTDLIADTNQLADYTVTITYTAGAINTYTVVKE